ncbi:hypothetical protein MJO28_000237 [Puccinia striiformis f. sp. tritici]|uniref:Uncharacterized protein n=1 Tax=Puccinia striiformis f. sp. tritici TaxID=168172 RepID=A0ACC0EWV5_9BASI|nr:hypothetical protein MJO28_000237 [Puccinia striiformis f. sp. tritici]
MLRLSRGGEDLEPVISEGIVELHHSKHHTVLNAAEDVIGNALNAGDISKQIELQAAIKFNGDGDLNHIGSFSTAVQPDFGGPELSKSSMNGSLISTQDSGWA